MSDPHRLFLEGETLCVRTPEGVESRLPLREFVGHAMPSFPTTGDIVLPDGVKFAFPTRKGTILVHQTPPRVHALRWICDDSPVPYGPKVKYQEVQLALPYVLLVSLLQVDGSGKLGLTGWNECFFRNAPLRSPEDELFYPALLNCSKYPSENEKAPLSWACTQHLEKELDPEWDDSKRVRNGLHRLLVHLFDTGFNRSSEHHEQTSWFSATLEAGIDERIASVERWQAESERSPLFATEVPWLPTGQSLRGVVERIRECQGVQPLEARAEHWARVAVNHGTATKQEVAS